MTQLDLASPKATSLLAYASVLKSLPAARRKVYEALVLGGPMTGAEVDRYLGGSRHHNKRISELRRMGLVRCVGVRPCSTSGHPAEAWQAVIGEPVKVEMRKSLKVRVAELVEWFESQQQPWTGPEVAHRLRQEMGVGR